MSFVLRQGPALFGATLGIGGASPIDRLVGIGFHDSLDRGLFACYAHTALA